MLELISGFRTAACTINHKNPLLDGPLVKEFDGCVTIRDFNSHIGWNYSAEDTTGSHDRLVRGKLTTTMTRPPLDESRIALLERDYWRTAKGRRIDVLNSGSIRFGGVTLHLLASVISCVCKVPPCSS
ncbi:hypothetical protein M405DRAFT_889652 [Rhizopogon salebrosus TDB-379]|nr:hypothetical protein M405DRAFT_889652 [Rhizopogon salebrosus TDB-379]